MHAGRSVKCPIGLLLEHHCPLPSTLQEAGTLPPALHSSVEVHSQRKQQQWRQQQQHCQSDEDTNVAAAKHPMLGRCTGLSLQDSDCDLASAEASTCSSEQTKSHAMSASLGSLGPPAELLTQEPVIADSEEEGDSPPVQSSLSSPCGYSMRATHEKMLCLDLSPDAGLELQQRAKDSIATAARTALHASIAGISVVQELTEPDCDAVLSMDADVCDHNAPMCDTLPDSCSQDAPQQADTAHLSSSPSPDRSTAKAGDAKTPTPLHQGAVAAPGAAATQSASLPVADGGPPAPRALAVPSMPAEISHALPWHQAPDTQRLQQQLLASHMPHKAVTAFLWSAVRHIVPQVLLAAKICYMH